MAGTQTVPLPSQGYMIALHGLARLDSEEPMDGPGYVYIMASQRNGTVYIGSTSNLVQRAYQHRNCLIDGFTKRHGCRMLVWYEAHDSIDGARLRELQMKKWKRPWKLSEIERINPEWADLYDTLF